MHDAHVYACAHVCIHRLKKHTRNTCICVCYARMCLCIHIHPHTIYGIPHASISTHRYTHTYTHMQTQACMHQCMRTCRHAFSRSYAAAGTARAVQWLTHLASCCTTPYHAYAHTHIVYGAAPFYACIIWLYIYIHKYIHVNVWIYLYTSICKCICICIQEGMRSACGDVHSLKRCELVKHAQRQCADRVVVQAEFPEHETSRHQRSLPRSRNTWQKIHVSAFAARACVCAYTDTHIQSTVYQKYIYIYIYAYTYTYT